MSDSVKETTNKINEMYKDLSYFDIYGGNVFLFVILAIILFVAVSYFIVMKNIQPIKDNWSVERCKPQNIPFAGIINKPDNMSFTEFTKENFNYCVQNILTSISGYAVQPLQYLTSTLTVLYNDIEKAIQSIRNITSNIRTNISNISQEIFGRIINTMIPFQQILISFVDIIAKIKGVLTAGLYTAFGTYETLKSLLGAIVQFIILILVAMTSVILGMWILPFTWPIAISTTAIFVGISIPLAIILVFMKDVLHIQTDMSIPGIPKPSHKCFDKNTILKMNDGSLKPICKIKAGDKLENDVLVTAFIKIDSKNVEMFNLDGVVVSSTHRVLYKGKWIYIKEHPDKIPINEYKEPFLYCLNTNTKTIIINNYIFADWDEIFDKELREIFPKNISDQREKIHKLLDGGFIGSTLIPLENGGKKEIKDIEVGAILKDSIEVYGVVEIETSLLVNLREYSVSNNIFYGSPNLNICENKVLLSKPLHDTKIWAQIKKGKLYHLLTNKEYFYASSGSSASSGPTITSCSTSCSTVIPNFSEKDAKFYHYNSNVELYLDSYSKKLLSIKYV